MGLMEESRMLRRKRKKRWQEQTINKVHKRAVLHKMIENSKASFKTMRKIQDRLRKEFPGSVDRNWVKKL
jgi:hypothetical protein